MRRLTLDQFDRLDRAHSRILDAISDLEEIADEIEEDDEDGADIARDLAGQMDGLSADLYDFFTGRRPDGREGAE